MENTSKSAFFAFLPWIICCTSTSELHYKVVHFLSVCLSLCSELFSLSEKLSWIFYLSLLYPNLFLFSTFFLFLPLFKIIVPSRENGLDIYPSVFYLNFSPFLIILYFSPSVQNYFPCRRIILEILPFPFLSQLFLLSEHSFFFSPLFRVISLAEELPWIFYLSLFFLNFSPFLNILSFSPSISLAEELSWIFYLSLFFLNFSPFFSFCSDNFPCRGIVLDILPFSSLSKLFPFLNSLSFSLFKISVPFRKNGLDI